MLRVVFASMAGPVILSALGPAYYGFTGGTYWRVVVWAIACVIPFLWWSRQSFKVALNSGPSSIIGRSFAVVAIIFTVAVAFVASDSLVYLLAGLLVH